jgi:hypothetical protein
MKKQTEKHTQHMKNRKRTEEHIEKTKEQKRKTTEEKHITHKKIKNNNRNGDMNSQK